MDNFEHNVEVNSVADLELDVREDTTDPDADFPCVGTLDNGVDPIWAGSAEAMAVGLRTDADVCQADAPTGGHTVESFESNGGPTRPTAVQPGQASVAVVCREPAMAWNSQRRICLDTLTLAYKLQYPEPCLWTQVTNAEESWGFLRACARLTRTVREACRQLGLVVRRRRRAPMLLQPQL